MVVRVSNPYPFIVLSPEPTVRTGIIVEVYDGDDPNTLLEVLDDTWARTWNDPLAGPGSGSFVVSARNPKLLTNPTLLAYGNIIRFRLDGIVRFAFQIEKTDRTQVAEDHIKPITVSGRGVLSKLEEAVAYTQIDGNPVRGFAGITPGHLARVLLEEAQTRGAINGVTWNFTDVLDSNNAPWAATLDQTERAGTDLLRVVERIGATAGEVYMTPGLELRMVNTRGVDRTLQTVDTGPVVLEAGKNITELERDEAGSIRNALLIETPAGFVERIAGDSVSTYGRREAFLSLGNVEDSAAVDRAADSVFAKSANPAARIAIKVTDHEGHRPYVDFEVGDWIKAPDAAGQLTKYRVRALTVSETAEGIPIFIPELATITEELENRLERWLASMSRGTLGGVAADVSEPVTGPTEETQAAITTAVTTGVDSGVSTHLATTSHPQNIDDLLDVDTTTTPPTDTQALIYDELAGLWVPGDVAAGGGGGGSPLWSLDLEDPLTALTGLTTYSGTWTITGGQLQVSLPGSTQCRAYSDTTITAIGLPTVVEVEVEIPTWLVGGTSTRHVRVGIGPSNTAGPINFAIRGDGNAYFEADAAVAVATAPYTVPAAGTWVKLRMVSTGDRFTGYIDGVKYLETNYSRNTNGAAWFPYVAAYSNVGGTVRFRNLKAWSLNDDVDAVAAGGGSAVPGWAVHLAAADDSPDIEESFTGDTLDPAWSVVDPGPATAYTRTVKRGLLSVGIQNAAADCAAIVQAVPAFTTGLRIEAAIRAMSYNGNYLMAGPVFSRGTTDTDPVIWCMSYNHRHSYIDNRDMRSGTFTNVNADHNAPGSALAWHSPLLYYAFEYDTTNGFRQTISPDGITWMDWGGDVANPLGGAPTHFGFGFSSWGSNLKVVTVENLNLYVDP